MEEADALADKIAVVAEGKLKCIGTSLNLKNTFGDGYRISITCEMGNEDKIHELLLGMAPSIKLIDSRAGSMIFTIPLIYP